MPVFWGDLHSHCAVSYGNGTPARAMNNAQQHLDFCSITGHAFWPDMPMDLETQNHMIGMHFGGFAKLQYYWPQLLKELEAVNQAGTFVTLPSYEWHSMEFGDYNCYFDSTNIDLIDASTPAKLAMALRKRPADFIMLPHHCGYVRGYRGINWDAFDTDRSPLVEVFSNHGCCEADDAYYDYYHSMGPRVGESLLREGLLKGHRFGFYASTDNHDGYPGHYGHGRVGVIADCLDRKSIWNGLKRRRTIASTGANIIAAVQLGSGEIGNIITRQENSRFTIDVEGTSSIGRVDLIEASGTDWRVRPFGGESISPQFAPGRYKIRIETGWGRSNVVSDWDVKAAVEKGKLLGCQPYFRYSNAEMTEKFACDRILCDENETQWVCHAASNPAGLLGGTHFSAGGTQLVVLEIDATESTRLKIKTGHLNLDLPISQLVRRSTGRQIEGFGSAAIKIHRAIPQREFCFRHEEVYQPIGDSPGFVYIRIVQTDNQTAWTSPIWFE